ncbi:MAG: aldolase catalytic domain-containing protein [Clostridia bacterium]|nr:aldolase catalytic domain-containing protein [Clostridia bacterium]
MKRAQILDCTLRDGAYLVDKHFGDTVVKGMISGLMESHIDWIEIGFLQTDEFGEGKNIFANAADAARCIPRDKRNTLFTVLADYSRYDVEWLEDNPGNSFDAVRVCFFKKEREDAVRFCQRVVEKGYKCFVQPVDILGYSDSELIDLIEKINPLDPYCFSIVDTFGSMYEDDLERVFHLIDHNLIYTAKIGFHSHNNLQMSSALSQSFLRMTYSRRESVVDTTVSGMGRGAGNTPTELIVQYMIQKLGYSYNLDAVLDLIDTYMPGICARCSWGYTTPYFIAGCYSAHVNNITYLSNKNGIVSKDIRYILNKIGSQPRKRYDYDLLETTYADYLSADVDDEDAFAQLASVFSGRKVMVIAPGSSALHCAKEIQAAGQDALVVSINHIPKEIAVDYVFISNRHRYNYWKEDTVFAGIPKIFTSNLAFAKGEQDYVISYKRLLKCGWENMDNSAILLLRLLDKLGVHGVGIAGFDGYDVNSGNYAQKDMERQLSAADAIKINKELADMLADILAEKEHIERIYFVTPSRFESVVNNAL